MPARVAISKLPMQSKRTVECLQPHQSYTSYVTPKPTPKVPQKEDRQHLQSPDYPWGCSTQD